MKVKVGDWKVGDNTFHQFMYKAMELATMEWTVFKDEGTSIWVRHIWTNPDGTKDRVEELVDKETGKTLKYIRNGKEEEVPAEGNPIKVISSKDTTVTVPAGTFAAKLMVTESDELGVADTWQNEQEIPLSGVLKVVFYKGANRLKITMQLVEFTKM
jgi:hypothetical protein